MPLKGRAQQHALGGGEVARRGGRWPPPQPRTRRKARVEGPRGRWWRRSAGSEICRVCGGENGGGRGRKPVAGGLPEDDQYAKELRRDEFAGSQSQGMRVCAGYTQVLVKIASVCRVYVSTWPESRPFTGYVRALGQICRLRGMRQHLVRLAVLRGVQKLEGAQEISEGRVDRNENHAG